MDPQNPDEVGAVGKCSYNQLVEKIIGDKTSEKPEEVSQGIQFLLYFSEEKKKMASNIYMFIESDISNTNVNTVKPWLIGFVSWNHRNGNEKYRNLLSVYIQTFWYMYRNDPKFSDRQIWANSLDLDQRSSLIRVYTFCHSVCMFGMPFSVSKPHCLNFRIITAKFSSVRIFGIFMVFVWASSRENLSSGFATSKSQTGLLSYKGKLGSWNFGYSK